MAPALLPSGLPQGLRVTAHVADVSDEAQMQRFRDEMAEQRNVAPLAARKTGSAEYT